MKDTLYFIITSLVEKPEEVEIQETQENGIIYLVVSVAKEDMGKIIGKQGKVIRAIRTVMKIKATKEAVRVNIALAE